jgi:ketosteroid isomerase-like protein
MMDTDTRERLIRAYYDAVDTESYPDFEDILTADAEHIRPGQGVLHGGTAVREYYETERSARNTTHDVDRIVHDDEMTLCLVTVTGEKPDGPFRRPVVTTVTFDETAERIASYHVYRGYAAPVDATDA